MSDFLLEPEKIKLIEQQIKALSAALNELKKLLIPVNKGLFVPIHWIYLDIISVRSYNCFRNEGFEYLGDIATKHKRELLTMSNFGKKSLNELEQELKRFGLTINMDLPNWRPQNVKELSSKFFPIDD